MKISIIIPCYNCSSNIAKLLNGFPDSSDFEFIIINDGSTDDTLYFVEEYINYSNKNINLLNIQNVGAAQARTIGLKSSSGDYIFFCDSDDMIFSENILFYVELIKKEKPDILFFSSIMYNKEERKKIDKVLFDRELCFSNPDEFLHYRLSNNNYTAAVWTYFFSKKLLMNSNASFTNRKAHEDHSFTLSLISHSNKIICNDNLLYIQNITPGSLTNSTKNKTYLLSRLEAFIESLSILTEGDFKLSKKNYIVWSLDAFLKLCKENKKPFFQLIASISFYKVIIKNYKLIFFYIISKFKCI